MIHLVFLKSSLKNFHKFVSFSAQMKIDAPGIKDWEIFFENIFSYGLAFRKYIDSFELSVFKELSFLVYFEIFFIIL